MPANPKKPATVARYLAALPPDRREAVEAVLEVIRENLDGGYAEGIQYGMPAFFVPHSVYPDGYHCDRSQPLPFAGVASQKNYVSIYLFCVYGSEAEQERFRAAWVKTGKKLDMGKSCIRFKKLDDVPLQVIGKTVKRMTVAKFVAQYEKSLAETGTKRPAAKKAAKKKKPAKKSAGGKR